MAFLVSMEKEKPEHIVFGSGAGNRNRTDDLVITNDVLYRLSHTSIVWRRERDSNPRKGISLNTISSRAP